MWKNLWMWTFTEWNFTSLLFSSILCSNCNILAQRGSMWLMNRHDLIHLFDYNFWLEQTFGWFGTPWTDDHLPSQATRLITTLPCVPGWNSISAKYVPLPSFLCTVLGSAVWQKISHKVFKWVRFGSYQLGHCNPRNNQFHEFYENVK